MSQEQTKDMSQYFYRASAADFMKIPGSPVAYWVNSKLRSAFERSRLLGDMADVKHGLSTGKNSEVVRLWSEISLIDFKTKSTSHESAEKSSKKWFPYNKGGDFRKWFGNCEYVLRYDQLGKDLMASFSGHRHDGKSHYFMEGVTWTFISSSNFAARYTPTGFIFDVSGSSLFVKDPKFITAFLCSGLCYEVLRALNPTLNFQVGNLKSLPLLEEGLDCSTDIIKDVAVKAIRFSEIDWNSYETSWNFTQLPLLTTRFQQPQLSANYQALRSHWQEAITEMQGLEEENNRLFIDAYGLLSTTAQFDRISSV